MIGRANSHSLFGLVWFCLPTGLISYVLFHSLLKGPLLGLLPEFVFSRLGGCVENYRSLPVLPWGAVIVSILLGAATHLVWDIFTHNHTLVVSRLAFLQARVFSIGTYPVYLYKLLQHASTGAGLLLLSWWSWRWLNGAAARAVILPLMFSPLQRRSVSAAIFLVPAALGLWGGMRIPAGLSGMSVVQHFVGKAVMIALPAFVGMLFVYSIIWHLVRLRRHISV
jgi:hypothetical protein